MNEETYGALKRIIEEVKEKRKADCLMKDCIINDMIGGDDIQLVESWIDEVTKEYEDREAKGHDIDCSCNDCPHSEEWHKNNTTHKQI